MTEYIKNPLSGKLRGVTYEDGKIIDVHIRDTDDVVKVFVPLDNGVTVQEWISVKDKLPPYNRDVLVYRPNMAMKILVDNYEGYYGEDDFEWHEGWVKYGNDIHGKPIITHWAYLPQPPKGDNMQ